MRTPKINHIDNIINRVANIIGTVKRIFKDNPSYLPIAGLTFNAAFGLYNIISGIVTESWWMLTVGTYYAVLGIMRVAVLRTKKSSKFLQCFTGVMLMCMTIPLVGTVILASVKDRGTEFHEIAMITIAVYAFTKITVASINLAKSRKNKSGKTTALIHISFADAFVSIFSLQRSMLVSFEGMSPTDIRIMNIATGTGVCTLIFALGANLLHKSRNTSR